MLLTLLKVLIFFAIVLAVALGLSHLSETGEGVRLVFAGTEYTLGPVQTVLLLLVASAAVWLALKVLGLIWAFIRFLLGDEMAINRYFARSRERKGYDALSDGMIAVAAGEGRLAQDKARKAARYLGKPHVTNLLAAQAAEVSGDHRKAGEVYRTLLGDDRTRFVGIRGLMRQKLAEGDTHSALALAQKAYALKPRHREVQDTLLKLETECGDWKGARSVLKDKRKQGDLPQDVYLRREAVLALQEAKDVLNNENSVSAREAAISAAKASPDLIPAAVLAARTYVLRGDARSAARILEKTWSVRPHPDVAAAYAEIEPKETPRQRVQRFDALLRRNPDHEESRLLRTELLIAAEDFPGARRALGDLPEKHPTVRTLSLMAAVERGVGADDSVVRGWLARALTASRGPQWVCDNCGHVMAEWAPVCESCKGFDTLSWREPDEKQAKAGPGAELLPLLVGAPQAAEPEPARPARSQHDPLDEVADVKPGMVPRERDYVAPAVEETPPEAVPEAGPEIPVTASVAEAEPTLVRPDVEPIDITPTDPVHKKK